MFGWHHWLDDYEFEQAPGVGQGSLACCSPWGCRVGQLSNWTELNISYRAGLMVINSSEFVYLKQCLFLFHFWSYFIFHDTHRFSSVTQSCPTLCDPMDCSTPGLPVHHQFPESVQTHVRWGSDAIQPSHPLLSPSLPATIFPSIRVFSNESVLHIRWPKYWSFSFSISPSNEYSGLISFRMDWLDLLVIQGTLKSLLQHHSSKASILQC